MEKPSIRPFIEKWTDEVVSFGFEFASPEMSTGETIASATATRTPIEAGGLVIDSTSYTASTATVKLSGGVNGNDYQVNILAVTSLGHTLRGNMLVRIIH